MKTALASIAAWQRGDKQRAYDLYLLDEGCLNINFNTFCYSFDNVVKHHEENVAAELRHVESVD